MIDPASIFAFKLLGFGVEIAYRQKYLEHPRMITVNFDWLFGDIVYVWELK